jgi:secernin
MGCDTFVAFPPTAPNGVVVFGKNSDRPAGEGQSIKRYPAGQYEGHSNVKCTYINIPQAASTYAVLLSQIDWMWGAEMGANECGVVIGNEAVWTSVPEETEKLLLGMDLVRLGLERGATAGEAKDIITTLLQQYGQGGPCAENDDFFTYHNSFLIADCREAWVLETAGRHWVAQRITHGGRNISNGLTIRTTFDSCSEGLRDYAKENGLWDGQEPFDFADCFSEGGPDESPYSRQACGKALLEKHDGTLDYKAMINILQDHKGGICMHGGFETTSSMVSELRQDGSQHWMTSKPHPCQSEYLSQKVNDE